MIGPWSLLNVVYNTIYQVYSYINLYVVKLKHSFHYR